MIRILLRWWYRWTATTHTYELYYTLLESSNKQISMSKLELSVTTTIWQAKVYTDPEEYTQRTRRLQKGIIVQILNTILIDRENSWLTYPWIVARNKSHGRRCSSRLVASCRKCTSLLHRSPTLHNGLPFELHAVQSGSSCTRKLRLMSRKCFTNHSTDRIDETGNQRWEQWLKPKMTGSLTSMILCRSVTRWSKRVTKAGRCEAVAWRRICTLLRSKRMSSNIR